MVPGSGCCIGITAWKSCDHVRGTPPTRPAAENIGGKCRNNPSSCCSCSSSVVIDVECASFYQSSPLVAPASIRRRKLARFACMANRSVIKPFASCYCALARALRFITVRLPVRILFLPQHHAPSFACKVLRESTCEQIAGVGEFFDRNDQ